MSPARAAGEILTGICSDLSLTITFDAARPAMPSIEDDTAVDLAGETGCQMEPDGQPTDTRTATFSADGLTLSGLNLLSCSGGVVTIPGWFDTDYPGFATVQGTYVITLLSSVAVVVFASERWLQVPAGLGAGVFLRQDTDPCPQTASGAEATTWVGSFAFVGKSEEVLEP